MDRQALSLKATDAQATAINEFREHDRTAPIADLDNYIDDIRRWD